MAERQQVPSSPGSESQPNFETALARIEAIVHELEEGQVGLAEALARYEEGVQLLRQCFGLLEKAERRIEMLVGVDAAGNPVTEPFDDTASVERAEQPGSRNRRRSAPTAKRPAETPGEKPPDQAAMDSRDELF